LSAYGYYLWQVLESLQLTAGLSYDWLEYPQNFRSSPISGGQQTEGHVSPKGGFIWKPLKNTVVRAAYTQSLGGASLEQSYQLEPSQVAGFNQLFRSVMPESVTGESAGARFETWNVALEQKFSTGTYFGFTAQQLNSTVSRQTGIIVVGPATYPSTTTENLNYTENRLLVTLDQLVGKYWSTGVHYQLADAQLLDQYPNLPSRLSAKQNLYQDNNARLNQIDAYARFNHPSGFFAQFDALWNDQHNRGYSPAEPGQSFWQFNIFAGYRFPRRHAEVTVGLLNLTGQDYQLNPLNAINELPRSRTLAVRFKINF
jgi:outer membrane receptor protein involved in Fe transport